MSMNANLKPNFELRAIAREKLKGKWLYAVLVCLVAGIVSGLLSWIPLIGLIYTLLIAGPVAFGLVKFFLKLRRDQNPIIEDLFDGFKSFEAAFKLQLWIWLFTILWSLLFIIPGIIAGFRYAMSYYILYDNPGMKPKKALEASKQMMLGRKGKLFWLCLSFIGWFLLCIPTAFIGLLWLFPYVNAAIANFYEDLKNAPVASSTTGVSNPAESIG